MLNALGLENGLSLRLPSGSGDGVTYFGCKKSIKKYGKALSQNSPQHQLLLANAYTNSTLSNGLGAVNGAQQMGATGTSNEEGASDYYDVRVMS